MKSGIDYFSLDVSLDDKFELIEAEFGLIGFSVVVKLFQKIYGTDGYYCEYTNEVALLFAKKIGLGGGVVSEIVTASIKRGIFDKELFDKYQVLTSTGIQKRYFEAVSRRKQITLKKQYLLINIAQILKNVDILIENVDNSFENDNISKQSKVKKSKEKKSKVEYKSASEFLHDLHESPELPKIEKDIASIISLYNNSCTKLLKVTETLHYSREKAIALLLKKHTKKDFETVFKKANESNFLCGGGSKGWKANLDWILKPDRFIQILEGSFDNTELSKERADRSYDIDEIDRFWDNVPKLV